MWDLAEVSGIGQGRMTEAGHRHFPHSWYLYEAYIAVCEWIQTFSGCVRILWGRVLLNDRALAREEPSTVILDTRWVPMANRTRQEVEAMVRMFRRLCDLVSMGLVSGDPNMVVLEVEMLGGLQLPLEVSC